MVLRKGRSGSLLRQVMASLALQDLIEELVCLPDHLLGEAGWVSLKGLLVAGWRWQHNIFTNERQEAHGDKLFSLGAHLWVSQSDLSYWDHEVLFGLQNKVVSEHDTQRKVELCSARDSLPNEVIVGVELCSESIFKFLRAHIELTAKLALVILHCH